MTGTIIERVRASGKCPPSLIRDVADNKFEAAVEKVVDSNGEYYFVCVLFLFFKRLICWVLFYFIFICFPPSPDYNNDNM